MRNIGIRLGALVILAAALGGCSKNAPNGQSDEPARDVAYYAKHLDEARGRDSACNKAKATGETLSDTRVSDCAAARKAVHDADNPVYVPGGGKPFSSAGGSN